MATLIIGTGDLVLVDRSLLILGVGRLAAFYAEVSTTFGVEAGNEVGI